jgi:hypothetical protein
LLQRRLDAPNFNGAELNSAELNSAELNSRAVRAVLSNAVAGFGTRDAR